MPLTQLSIRIKCLTAVDGVIAMMKKNNTRPITEWTQENTRILYKSTMEYLGSQSEVLDDLIVRRIIYGVANKLGINEFHEEQFHRIFGDDVQ
jgi:hypothetical protein